MSRVVLGVVYRVPAVDDVIHAPAASDEAASYPINPLGENACGPTVTHIPLAGSRPELAANANGIRADGVDVVGSSDVLSVASSRLSASTGLRSAPAE